MLLFKITFQNKIARVNRLTVRAMSISCLSVCTVEHQSSNKRRARPRQIGLSLSDYHEHLLEVVPVNSES